MKTSKLILAAALLSGLVSFSYAGMGAHYWSQQGKDAEAQKARTTAAAESNNGAMNCAACACCAGGK